MIKKIITLFIIGRKLALSDALNIVSKVYKIPISIKIFFSLIGLFGKKNLNKNFNEEERLCRSMESMGITFIKLGQFLATRPDIIGEKLSDQLQTLQDKVPAFSKDIALNEIREGVGNVNYKDFINISEPIAAASIAQVHKAQIKEDGVLKEVAIKVLRPNIKKVFNDEIEALMLLAYVIELLVKKTKRLKLVEVVFLLKEITNHEMDLRFEAAAANEFYENTRNDVGFKIPKIYWKLTSDNVLTLDWVEAISIREVEKIMSLGVNLKTLARDIIQHFLRHAVRDGYFHADMHQGNLLVDNSGQLIFIDFGIMGRIDKINRRFLAEILYGFIQRDYVKVAEVHFQAGLVPRDASKEEFAQALRSVGEPIFGQSIKDISGGKLVIEKQANIAGSVLYEDFNDQVISGPHATATFEQGGILNGAFFNENLGIVFDVTSPASIGSSTTNYHTLTEHNGKYYKAEPWLLDFKKVFEDKNVIELSALFEGDGKLIFLIYKNIYLLLF